MSHTHLYDVSVTWTGDRGSGTSGYRDYQRDHEITAPGPEPVLATAHPAVSGDATRWNPEQLFTAALSECHMLWYLHLCSAQGVVVTGYTDTAHGEMEEHHRGGSFTTVTLHPHVTVASPDMVDLAIALHEQAHRHCFIASSVNFPVTCEPRVVASHRVA